MGLWDKIKKTLLTNFWPEPKKSSKHSIRNPSKPRRSVVSARPARKKKEKARPKPAKNLKAAVKKIPKKSLKKPPAKIKKMASAKKVKRASKPSRFSEKPSLREFIGTVTHYFPQVNVAALKIEKRGLMIGEVLRFHGHTTKFKTVIKSMQIDRKPVLSASIGDEIGILVPRRVRAGDQVFFQDK